MEPHQPYSPPGVRQRAVPEAPKPPTHRNSTDTEYSEEEFMELAQTYLSSWRSFHIDALSYLAFVEDRLTDFVTASSDPSRYESKYGLWVSKYQKETSLSVQSLAWFTIARTQHTKWLIETYRTHWLRAIGHENSDDKKIDEKQLNQPSSAREGDQYLHMTIGPKGTENDEEVFPAERINEVSRRPLEESSVKAGLISDGKEQHDEYYLKSLQQNVTVELDLRFDGRSAGLHTLESIRWYESSGIEKIFEKIEAHFESAVKYVQLEMEFEDVLDHFETQTYLRWAFCRIVGSKHVAVFRYDNIRAFRDLAVKEIASFTTQYPLQQFIIQTSREYSSSRLTGALPGSMLELLRGEIYRKMRRNFHNQVYISSADLAPLCKHWVLGDALKEVLWGSSKKLFNQLRRDIVHTAARLFAACIWARTSFRILTILVQKGFNDSNLPTAAAQNLLPRDDQFEFEYLLQVIPCFFVITLGKDQPFWKVTDETIMPINFDTQEERIGSGAFAELFRVSIDPAHNYINNDLVKQFALKIYSGGNDAVSEAFSREQSVVTLIKEYPHKHIVSHEGSWIQKRSCYILYPLASCNLREMMNSTNPPLLSKKWTLWFISQILGLADAIRHLHHLETPKKHEIVIMHGDIKPENILVFQCSTDKLGEMKLSDYDSGTVISNENISSQNRVTYNFRGTVSYGSPESRMSEGISRSADLWSFGCVLLELLVWIFVPDMHNQDRFADLRAEPVGDKSWTTTSDEFWYLESGQDGKAKAQLKPVVQDVLRRLSIEHCSTRSAFSLLVDIVRDLLTVSSSERLPAIDLVTRLEDVMARATVDLVADPIAYQESAKEIILNVPDKIVEPSTPSQASSQHTAPATPPPTSHVPSHAVLLAGKKRRPVSERNSRRSQRAGYFGRALGDTVLRTAEEKSYRDAVTREAELQASNEPSGEIVSLLAQAPIENVSSTTDVPFHVTSVIQDSASYGRELEELEHRVYRLLSSSGIFETNYTETSSIDGELQAQGRIRMQVLGRIIQQLGQAFDYIGRALVLIKDEGDSEKLFSIIVESTRQDTLSVIPVSLASIQAFQPLLRYLSELSQQIQSGHSESPAPVDLQNTLKTLEDMATQTLNYLELPITKIETINAHLITHSIVCTRIVVQILAIGITSYVTSHLGSLSQTVLKDKPNTGFQISVGPGCQITFMPRRLACLQAFVGAPVHAFTYKSNVAQPDGGYLISTLLADFDDLWGPVQIIYPSEDTDAASEILTFGGRLQALNLTAMTPAVQLSGDETLCHWSSWSDTEIDHCNFDPTCPLLIGSQQPLFRVNPDCTDITKQTHYQTWTRTTLHTRPIRSEKSGTGYNATARVPFIGGLGHTRQYQVKPQESSKNALIAYFYNVNQGTVVDGSIPACIDEIVGLEISRCTGNALRLSLWDVLRNPEIVQFVRSVSDSKNNDFPHNWVSYESWKSLSDSNSMTAQQRSNLLRAISKVVEQIRGTGVLKKGEVTAWDVPSTEARTFKQSWAGMLSDSCYAATFAFLSSRCLVYELGRDCSQAGSKLVDSTPPAMLTCIEITAKVCIDQHECEPSRFAPAEDSVRASHNFQNDHLRAFDLGKKHGNHAYIIDNSYHIMSFQSKVATQRLEQEKTPNGSINAPAIHNRIYTSEHSASQADYKYYCPSRETEKFQTATGPHLPVVPSVRGVRQNPNQVDSVTSEISRSSRRGSEATRQPPRTAPQATRRVAQVSLQKAASLTDLLQKLANSSVQSRPQQRSRTSSVRSNSSIQSHTSRSSINTTTRHGRDGTTSTIDWLNSGIIYEALQKELINLETWLLDDEHGRLEFCLEEDRCPIEFDFNSNLCEEPLRMIWKPRHHKLDPSRALAWSDELYKKGDNLLKKAVTDAKRKLFPDTSCKVDIKFEFCEAKRREDFHFNQTVKWVCVLNKDMPEVDEDLDEW